MNRFAVTIHDDGTCSWQGVDTGKCTVLAMNTEKKFIVLHTAGGTWSDNSGQHYGGAKVNMHEYEEGPSPREIFLPELFGEMEWQPRSNKWTPKFGEDHDT